MSADVRPFCLYFLFLYMCYCCWCVNRCVLRIMCVLSKCARFFYFFLVCFFLSTDQQQHPTKYDQPNAHDHGLNIMKPEANDDCIVSQPWIFFTIATDLNVSIVPQNGSSILFMAKQENTIICRCTDICVQLTVWLSVHLFVLDKCVCPKN